MKIRFVFALCCFTLLGAEEEVYTPWLTGPLLAPPGEVTPEGSVEIQPYFYASAVTGMYGPNWKAQSIPDVYLLNLQLFTLIGLTPWMDMQITPTVLWNQTDGVSRFRAGDFPIGLDFQVIEPTTYRYFPGLLFTIRETFPTGKYQNLNPANQKVDVGGLGTFATELNVVLYKLYHIKEHHFFSATLSYGYTFPAPVKVRGFNAYGGNEETQGTVYPGGSWTGFLSFEYTFNQNWGVTLDNIYQHNNKIRFSGESGGAVMTKPSLEQLSFAPAIEYNFSSQLGMNAGAWLSGFRRNAPQFRNFVVSIIMVY